MSLFFHSKWSSVPVHSVHSPFSSSQHWVGGTRQLWSVLLHGAGPWQCGTESLVCNLLSILLYAWLLGILLYVQQCLFPPFLSFHLFYLFATFVCMCKRERVREKERGFLQTQVLFFILQSVFGKGDDGEMELLSTLEKTGRKSSKIKLLLPVSRMHLTQNMDSCVPWLTVKLGCSVWLGGSDSRLLHVALSPVLSQVAFLYGADTLTSLTLFSALCFSTIFFGFTQPHSLEPANVLRSLLCCAHLRVMKWFQDRLTYMGTGLPFVGPDTG